MSARRYRKKPVEIEAVQFRGSSTDIAHIQRWIDGDEYVAPGMRTADRKSMMIETLEGLLKARPGDWIIRGVHGEFYPCKPDIFEATYEPVGVMARPGYSQRIANQAWDAERERLLDLLERTWHDVLAAYGHHFDTEPELADVLHEYGRLGDRGPGA